MTTDWQSFAANFGIAGLLIAAIVVLGRLWISSNERVQMERNKVEDKKADAMVSALGGLTAQITTHHTADIQSHSALSQGIAELKGHVLEAINWQERTPVESPVPRPSVYGIRPKTNER